MALIDRRVRLEACFNFRDLGGYQTSDGRHLRPGLLYRADTLHRLTTNDLDVLQGLQLRTVIDLRTRGELDRHGRVRLADDNQVAHHHLPMIDELRSPDAAPEEAPSPERRAARYLTMIEQGREAVVDALRLLADPTRLPAVFHCTAGKDRTGVLAALVLGQLGVPDDTIASDYALSELAVDDTMAWIEANDPDTAATFAAYPGWVWDTSAKVMLAFLALARAKYGSISALLTHLGVDPTTLDSLPVTLLDP